MILKHKFSIGFQNIEGLHDGVGCKINEIKPQLSNDIEILAETWGCNCEVSFDDYIPHYVSPQKHHGVKKGRRSGGFLLLLKKYLSKNFKILKSSNNFIWIEINKNCIKNLQENFLILCTYINDITSSYYDDRIFEELYSDILRYSGENIPILFTGDLNGRTGVVDDIYRDDGKTDHNPIPIPNTFVNLPIRKNCDNIVNSHGKKIIYLCHTLDLKILNGRMIGDAIGNFTHLNSNMGESTIDYSICNKKMYECVDNFMVLPLNELSDHSKIVTVLKSSITAPKIEKDEYKWNPLNPRFKWDNRNKQSFSNALKNENNLIEDILQRIEAGLIDSSGEKIQQLYMNATEIALERTKKPGKNWKKRKKSKKWFDKECDILKRQVQNQGIQKHNAPHNNFLRTKYCEKLKEYKNKCKYKISILAIHF